jgi:hypothetical protein
VKKRRGRGQPEELRKNLQVLKGKVEKCKCSSVFPCERTRGQERENIDEVMRAEVKRERVLQWKWTRTIESSNHRIESK